MNKTASLQNTASKQPSHSLTPGLMLQRKCACGGSASSSLTGECEECKNKYLQKKLSIGASNDPLEQEADRVADQVMAVPANSTVGGALPRIQRFTGQATEGTDTAPASVDRVLANTGRPLEPALRQDMEQRFGHDFSRVRVHADDRASESAQDVNADAYTVEQNIVFGSSQFTPGTQKGRRLIAHELSHVVQQTGEEGWRSGSGGGQSDRSSINQHSTSKGFGLQRKPKTSQKEDWTTEQAVLLAAADIVQHLRDTMITGAPANYKPFLFSLLAAATGKKNGAAISGSERVQQLDTAMHCLQPLIGMFEQSEDRRIWVNDQLLRQVAYVRETARFSEAEKRVESSVAVGKEIIELPDDQHPHEQAAVLRSTIHKLVPTLDMINKQVINEQVIRMAHDEIHHEAEAMMGKGYAHGKFGPGALVELQNVLMMLDAVLKLNDKEFQEEIGTIGKQEFLHGVATFGELVKVSTQIIGGAVGMSASYTAVIARVVGDANLAARASGVARASGLVFANIVTGVEIVHGILVIIDPHATADQKVDAAVEVSSGAAWFIGKRVAGAAVGAAVSTAILITYAEMKLMLQLYWEANIGVMAGWMNMAYETITSDGDSIAELANDLGKAGMLRVHEKDPEKLAALGAVEKSLAVKLGDAVDTFINHCEPRSYAANVAPYPGTFPIFRELFAPLKKYKGAKTPEAAAEAAKFVLEKITWSLKHAPEIVLSSATQKPNLANIEAAVAKQEHHGKDG